MDGRAQWHMHAPTSCTCCGHIADRLVARSVDEGIGSCWSRVVVASASCLVVCAVMAMRGRAEDGGDREIDGGFDRCSCLHEGFLQQLAFDKTANTKRSNGSSHPQHETAALQEETVGLLRWVVAARGKSRGLVSRHSAEHSGVNDTIFVGSNQLRWQVARIPFSRVHEKSDNQRRDDCESVRESLWPHAG